jgi:hypothetical protein
MSAAANGNYHEIEKILAKGANVNVENREGNTPLILAIRHKSYNTALVLIENGASINVKNKRGLTPLIVAAKNGLPRTVQLLIANGVDVNEGVYRGMNALMWAEYRVSAYGRRNKIKVKELLIAAGARPIQTAKKKSTLMEEEKLNEQKLGKPIVETTTYDPRRRPMMILLKNLNGKTVAKKIFQFNKFRSDFFSNEKIFNATNNNGIHETDYDEFNKPKNRKWLCLDGDGNIIIQKDKVILINPFNADQKSYPKNIYKMGFLMERIREIYPCKNCAEGTGIKDCVYVW